MRGDVDDDRVIMYEVFLLWSLPHRKLSTLYTLGWKSLGLVQRFVVEEVAVVGDE